MVRLPGNQHQLKTNILFIIKVQFYGFDFTKEVDSKILVSRLTRKKMQSTIWVLNKIFHISVLNKYNFEVKVLNYIYKCVIFDTSVYVNIKHTCCNWNNFEIS